MILIALDFWSIVVYGFFVSVFFIGYQLTWRLAYFSEAVIVNLARAGLYSMARGILFALIGYTEQTYQQSRFIIWNQVHVRFFLLWGTSFLLVGLVLLFRVQSVIWIPLALIYIVYRLVTLWLTPQRPPIHTQDPTLKKLIQDVNEPLRSTYRNNRPMIRQWDYLDELYAEST